jgi:hypothetical protein
MELLDRYLHAIEFWLPKRQRQDIIAELSEDLRSQIDEKENELGRKLNDAEVEGILKRCGAPLVVAERYLPPGHLIGPLWFPLYRFVLKVMLFGYVVPWLLVWIGFLIFDPAYRAANPRFAQIHNLWTLWLTVLYFFFFTTAAFAFIERSADAQARLLEDWNPRKLPPVRDPNRIPRFNSLFEIAAITVFNVWFVSLFWPRPVIDLYRAQITLAPVWQVFFAGFLVLAAANTAIAAANLFRPYWTPLRASLRLLSDGLGGALFCWLLKAQVLTGISTPSLSASKAAELTNLINLWMAKTLPWAIVCVVGIICSNGYRIVRLWRAHQAGTPIAPAVNDLSNPMVNGN